MHVLRIILIVLMVLLLAVLVPSGTAIGEIAVLPADMSGGCKPDQDDYLSGTEYQDGSLHIVVSEGRMFDTNWMAVSVTVANASQLRTSVAGNLRSPSSALATTLARRVNAVLAINGDYYGYNTIGYSVRQGSVIRRKAKGDIDVLIIDDEGNLEILPNATQEECDAFAGKVMNAFNFGPGLVIDGRLQTEFTQEELFGRAPDKVAQRICLAQTGPLAYLIIYCEGPENEGSVGMTIPQFVELVGSFDTIENAYNLDGGSSATIVFGGKKINGLSSRKMREVSDIIYFASAWMPSGE